MSFYNPCCRKELAAFYPNPSTGDTHQCLCGNEFMHDGKAWINLYELGQRKIDKYRQIKRVNDLITSATRVQPSHTTEF